MSPAAPQMFREWIAGRFGLRFEDSRLDWLGDVLTRRAGARGVEIGQYLMQLDADPGETIELAQDVTVGETYFFRNSAHFAALQEHVLPELMRERTGTRRLSVLSAGCSSGEEPYSLAMLVQSRLPMPPWQVAIRAIDLNPAALRKAQHARYGSWALRETPPDMLARWFTPRGREMELAPEIRGAVQFGLRNLADPDADVWRGGPYDLIFCRNVIMYFTPAVQQAVVARLARVISPGGFLFLGHAETLRGLSRDFRLVHTQGTFYYQRRGDDEEPAAEDAIVRFDVPAFVHMPDRPALPADTLWYEAIEDASRRIERLSRPAPVAAPALAAPSVDPGPSPLAAALELFRHERFEQALDRLDRLPDAARSDPEVMLLRAILLVQTGRLAAAAELCATLLANDEINAGANYVLALCFEGNGDRAGALVHYDRAADLDPQFAMPLLRRGLLAKRSRDLVAAVRDLAAAHDLLEHEDSSRLLLFGGGFTRAALTGLCATELAACEVRQ